MAADIDINGEPGGRRYACKDILELVDEPTDAVSGVEFSDLLWECCVAGTFTVGKYGVVGGRTGRLESPVCSLG